MVQKISLEAGQKYLIARALQLGAMIDTETGMSDFLNFIPLMSGEGNKTRLDLMQGKRFAGIEKKLDGMGETFAPLGGLFKQAQEIYPLALDYRL